MEVKILLRGFAVGVLAGLLAFVFSRIFAEPVVQSAIDYESARDVAQNALDRAAGLTVPAPDHEVFTRGVQRGIGIGTGLVLFGVALGGFLAVAYAVSSRWTVALRPRQLALRVAGAGFLTIFLVPYLKYPANPPSIGHPDTIGARSALYVVMILASLLALAAAIMIWRRLVTRVGNWSANLLAGLAFAVIVGVVMLILPPLGHLHDNVAQYGRHATETPLPLRDPSGRIVYPGFPADVLSRFRLYSLLNQALLWGTIGLAFGYLAERLPAHLPGRVKVPTGGLAAAA